ncbi:platelet-derived growth factor subunit B-like, partial [Scleropages formosus]
MSAWVLQLALLTASLRFANAQGDPLPLALVELVRSSPINSIEDLQLLLLSDSAEEEPDNQLHIKGLHSNDTINRIPRSLEPQPAQQALCKVRTEVLEVTRTMLDRRNANFLLWPPCVEVQRCSGCCNARTVQCMPTVTHMRYLQVMKIQYVNKQPHYEKAVISVVDHIECRCQIEAPAKGQRTSHKRPPHRRKNSRGPESRVHSKEELHRQDEHKQHQKIQFGEGGVWPQKFGRMQTLATQTEVHVVAGHYQTHPWEVQTNQTPLQGSHTNHTGKLQDAGLLWQPDLRYQAMEESSTQATQGLAETERPSPSLHVLRGSQVPEPTRKGSVEWASQRDRGFSSAEGEPEVHGVEPKLHQTHERAGETRQEGRPNDRHSGVLETEGSQFQESEQLHVLQ